MPGYDRSALVPRIVHIGVGGFHRAHLALYTDELAADGGDWGIRGLGMLANDAAMRDALAAQDGLYTLIEREDDRATTRVIGSLVDYAFTAGRPDATVEILADPQVAIVSMTITEAGYGATDRDDTAFHLIAAALGRRRDSGNPPLTILSCDNLPGNGDAARAATLAAARRQNAELAGWIETACTFPNSMVDRITPATTDDDRAWLAREHGIADRWPVVAEPFRQWVLEDRFAERPAELGSRRRRVHRRRRVVGALQTPAAQRRALEHGLPVRAGRHHVRRRGDGHSRGPRIPRDPAPTARRSRRCTGFPAARRRTM